MPTIQNLKKKLKVINSTKKMTQAMKTASSVKFSKLSSIYSDYSNYENQCRCMYKVCNSDLKSAFLPENSEAPHLYILISSNKGMCGSFNNELFSFFEKILTNQSETPVIICCGKKAKGYLNSKKIPFYKGFVFPDIPSYHDACELFGEIKELMKSEKVSDVKVIYPKYLNMINQSPECENLFVFREDTAETEEPLFIPDKQTVILGTCEKIIVSILYRKILETALGAQAATLITMRSAFDTACDYNTQLKTQINRMRQGQVTADVIEISSEYSMKEDE